MTATSAHGEAVTGKGRRTRNRPLTRAQSAKTLVPLLVPFLVFAGISLRTINFANVAGRTPDEGVYTSQALAVAEMGPIAGTRALIADYNTNAGRHLYPPPTRIGFYWVFAGLAKTVGGPSPTVGAALSLVASVTTLCLSALMALRFFSPAVALGALALFAVSPMDLAIARRCWQDAFVGALGTAMLYCLLELTREGRRLRWQILVAGLGGYGLLVKESGFVTLAICALLSIVVLFGKDQGVKEASLFAALCAASISCSVLFLTYAAGGAGPLVEALRNLQAAVPINAYGIEYQSGPVGNFLGGLWLMSPAAAVLSAIGCLAIAWKHFGKRGEATERRSPDLLVLVFFLAFLAVVAFGPNTHNFRYLSPAYAASFLVAGVGTDSIVRAARALAPKTSEAATGLLGAGLLIAALHDYKTFRLLFLDRGAADLSIGVIRSRAD